MKRILSLIVIFTLAFSLNAYSDISQTRGEVGSALNETVSVLKSWFSGTEKDINETLENSTSLKETAINLKERSEDAEVNPKVLEHGRAAMHTDCDYKTQNLQWVNNKWDCVSVELSTGCEDPTSDEYSYTDENGNKVCSRNPEGDKINYKWQFRGYSSRCSNPVVGYDKLYDCVYNNKAGGVVHVNDSYCTGSKPAVGKKTCTANWVVGPWGSCSRSCGGGWKSRSVTCPAHYSCPAAKPGTSTSCNTHACKPPPSCCMGGCSESGGWCWCGGGNNVYTYPSNC